MRISVICAAVAAAALIGTGAAAAGEGPPAGIHGALQLRVVSSPPEYVSGNDARVEVAVPDKTALSDVRVWLNGGDVTSAFAQDPEGNHQLEGVVTGLPLGASTLGATIPGPGKAKPNRVELELTNWPLDGPIFSGARQTVFKCTPLNRLAAASLTTM